MAVLIAPSADETVCAAEDAQSPVRFQTLATLSKLLSAPLPHDVRDEEYTIALLFRASLVLNFLTGGAPDMTFSARCHRARRISRSLARRTMWHGIAMGVDMACGVLRGEREHCAVAWANHRSRGVASRRA